MISADLSTRDYGSHLVVTLRGELDAVDAWPSVTPPAWCRAPRRTQPAPVPLAGCRAAPAGVRTLSFSFPSR